MICFWSLFKEHINSISMVSFFSLPSILTLLPMVLKDLGLVCFLPEIPRFCGRHVAQCQALGSRQSI